MELFPQLQILDPSFTTFYPFANRYCDGQQGQFGFICKSATNLQELNCLLRKKFMIRRTKDEVYSELGAKDRQMVHLKNLQLSKEDIEDIHKFSHQFEEAKNKKKQQQEILMLWYNETAGLKADAVKKFLADHLAKSDEKCLIFVHHAVMMSAISDFLAARKIPFMCIDGSTRPDTRDSNVQRFQNDPSLRCAVLSIRACGNGITLTAASTVIFAELDWTPSNMIQAEARAHRIGQERQVKCVYLIAPGTVDNVIWNLLQAKQYNLTKAGLSTAKEHLSLNMTTTSFDAGSASPPGTPTTSANITTFFTPTGSSPGSPDVFYQCESGQDDSNDNVIWIE